MNEKYIKKDLLGKGGRAAVWLVENKDADMPAALKWYEDKREAEREKEILRRFGGKGVPYLIDYMENEKGAGVVMEYVEGKSLRTLLEEKRIFSEEETTELIMKAAKILAVFHKQVPRIIYGDLKPENIMVTPEGEVCFIDFGSVLYEGEKERRVYGTREYLPPSEGEKISAYRDTYGLGVVLYEMLTGSVLSKGIACKKADVSHLSKDCRRIMQKAVKIHETEGYADGGEMYEDLKEAMENMHKEKKRRKRHMFRRKNKNRKNYFICDLKRMVHTGYMRGICLFLAAFTVFCIMWKENEVEGAAMEWMPVEKTVTERTVVRNDPGKYGGEDMKEKDMEEEEGKESMENARRKDGNEQQKKSRAEEKFRTEIETEGEIETEAPRDAYGRKLIIRK